MMALRIIIGIVVVVAVSAWAFYIDKKSVSYTRDSDEDEINEDDETANK